jgi:hypothetical protein
LFNPDTLNASSAFSRKEKEAPKCLLKYRDTQINRIFTPQSLSYTSGDDHHRATARSAKLVFSNRSIL